MASPLFDRAWVLQEQLLSKRIIYFGENELAWQCSSKIQCECGQREPVEDMRQIEQYLSFGHWAEIVSLFSKRQLSRTTDKLAALSGIASRYQDFQPDSQRYLAGIWEKELLNELVWIMPRPSLEVIHAPRYIAPSW